MWMDQKVKINSTKWPNISLWHNNGVTTDNNNASDPTQVVLALALMLSSQCSYTRPVGYLHSIKCALVFALLKVWKDNNASKEDMDDSPLTLIPHPLCLHFCPQSVQGFFSWQSEQSGMLGIRRKVRDFVNANLFVFAIVNDDYLTSVFFHNRSITGRSNGSLCQVGGNAEGKFIKLNNFVCMFWGKKKINPASNISFGCALLVKFTGFTKTQPFG